MNDTSAPRLRWLATATALCAILILPVTLDAFRGWIFPDSTSYFDMASTALHAPAILLKNGYWSPAYPAVLAVMLAVARPSPARELQSVYVVHWLLFVFATACFGVALASLLQWLRRNSWPELERDGALGKALLAFSYALFLLVNMNRTLWYATPDMLLQGLVYLSAAWALRLFLPDSSWKTAVALGISLGVGYLAKAAMFPVALVLIGIVFLKLGRRYALIAMACFCLIAAPQVLSLSLEKHRFTFGDTGKLNYAWFVAGLPQYAGWNGQPPENGTPLHGPRRISEVPLILEFRTPLPGTHPLWYDASYWWEGLRVPLSLRRQLAALFRPLTQAHSVLTLLLGALVGLAPLCLLHSRVRRVIRMGGVQTWILILWPAAACVMYSLVLFNFRYTAGYIVLLGIGAATLVLQAFPGSTRTGVLLAACLLLGLSGMLRLRPLVAALNSGENASLTRLEGTDDVFTTAAAVNGLTQLGIRSGDEISLLGRSLDCYYARLLGVRIVAQIWENPDEIQGLPAPEVQRLLSQLRQIGIKAVVARSKPGFLNDQAWSHIPRTDMYVRIL